MLTGQRPVSRITQYELLIGPLPELSWNVVILLFFCNPIGQICLGGTGYSSQLAL